jgi:dipeptidyl aminopeptidase/acylaminoacyl peptidase
LTVLADGKSTSVDVPVGSTVQEAISQAGVTLSTLDQSDPPPFTVVSSGIQVRVVRIDENFEIEQVVVPFQRQVVRNESLPAGENRLSQPGSNGKTEITYRVLSEDGVEVSRTIVKSTVLAEAVPEIIMVGSQTPFLSLTIPGKIAYLSSGNAWIMEGSTGERRPVVTTGDLDGRVFSLSPDKTWLLFTRSSKEDEGINSLWAARLDEKELLVDLKASNIIHFAGFSPLGDMIAFSTVEPRSTAPGWQANNDLQVIELNDNGFVSKPELLLEINSGGVYGWWGTDFTWTPDSATLAFARPDAVGIFDQDQAELKNLVDLLPLQTGGDWAWVPGMSWGPDGITLYTVLHYAPPGASKPEQSPQFNLLAISLAGGSPVPLAESVGMFAYPVASPMLVFGEGAQEDYQVSYLQAITPLQSETSRYRLAVMDRDGSNKRILFPEEGAQGLDPQRVVWSPAPLGELGYVVAVVYQNNIYLLDVNTGQAQQITGDGLVNRIDWK